MICQHCHHEVSDEVSSCPYCGGALAPHGESLPLWSDAGLAPLGKQPSPEATSINVKRYDVDSGHAETHEPAATEQWPSADNLGVFTSADERQEQAEQKRPVFGPANERDIHTQLVAADPQQAQHTRIVEVSLPPAVKRAMRDKADSVGEDEEEVQPSLFEQLARESRHFYQRLHRLDRYALWTLLTTLVATFSPWFFQRGEGLSSGVEGVGFLSCVAALCAIGAIYMRTIRRRLSGMLIMAQFIAVVGIAAPPLFYLFVGTRQLVLGAYAVLLGAAIAVFFTLARLTRLNV